MKKPLKKYQKILIIIGLFIVVFTTTFTALYFYEDKSQIEDLVGNGFQHKGYVETVDGTYIGELYGNEFQGFGQFNFISNEIYTGEWETSTMSGDGKMIFNGVGTYDGDYLDSVRDGEGSFVWDNGDKYVGDWDNDKIHGEGTYTFSNGNYVSGTFKSNKIYSGTYYISAEKYSCEMYIEDSVLTNKIKLTVTSGVSYEGEISEGKLNGYGIMKYKDGATYTGNFKNNQRSGNGVYVWKSGECYDGAWEKDKMSGQGVYYYKTKDSYPKLTGKFSNGVPTGNCTYYETSYVKYITTWSNGKCTKVSED